MSTETEQGEVPRVIEDVPSEEKPAAPVEVAEESSETAPQLSKRTEKKISAGMGALLQQLRSAAETSGFTLEETVTTVEQPQNLNRKQRRALLQAQNAPEKVEELETELPPAKKAPPIVTVEYSLAGPSLVVKEAASFQEKVPQFGFGASCSNNYVKLAKISPDGSCLMTTSQDRVARVFRIEENESNLVQSAHLPLGDLPYDAVWHPCGDLLATTARLHPIHMWDTNGQRMATYRGINHLDELEAAQTVTFSHDGLTLYAGYNKCIRIWDCRRAGRHQQEIKTYRKQSHEQGQKARVSSIAMNPGFDGVYAVGFYGPTIGLYSNRTNFVECMFSGDFQAVTDLKYSPDGLRLYSCGRKTGTVQCFDLRNPGSVLFTLRRPFDTQQKVHFDIDRSERFLFSGTSDGEIAVFDLQEGGNERDPALRTKISSASVPCVSLHPKLPLLAACTGERVFPFPQLPGDENEAEPTGRSYLETKDEVGLENTVQLWSYAQQ